MLAGKTNTYDANAGARGNHIKSCIDSNLRNDSQFREAILVVENRYSATKAKRSNKKKRKSKKKRTLQLSHSSDVTGELYCYYGESQEEHKPRTSFCPKEKNFFW